MGIWDDDFTGTNGDPPDPTKWEVDANPDDEFVIASNTYALSKNTFASPAETWVWITKGLFLFAGDFDFQIDIPSYSFSNSSGSWGYVGLGIETEDGTVWELIGPAVYSSFTTRGWVFGSYASGTPEYRIAYSAFSATMSKLRFTRSGTTVKGYYWDTVDSNWQWDNDTDGYTFTGIGSGSVRVLIRGVLHGTTASVVQNWTFDNFLVNSGTATKMAIQGPITEGLGFQSEVIGYNETGIFAYGVGFQDGIDAESDDVFLNYNLGLNDGVDTSENTQNVIAASQIGMNGTADAYVATEEMVFSFGLNGLTDAVFLTKHIEDGLGLNAVLDSNREFYRILENEAGLNAAVDAYNYTEWAAENLVRARKFFVFTLTGSADGVSDVEIPMTSFQARKRSDSPTYLSVIVRKFDYAAQITARQNGDIVIEAVYYVDGAESLRQEIVRAPLQTITLDQGARSRSISLSGYKTVTYYEKSITLQNPVYKRLSDGKLQYRFADIDFFLNPSDELTVGEDTFTVGSITYYVSGAARQMDVFQVEQ